MASQDVLSNFMNHNLFLEVFNWSTLVISVERSVRTSNQACFVKYTLPPVFRAKKISGNCFQVRITIRFDPRGISAPNPIWSWLERVSCRLVSRY